MLLDTLRNATNRPDLEFVAPPTSMSGGYYAEMLRFRLVDPPAAWDRDLVARIVPNPGAGVREATVQRAVAEQGFATPIVRLTADETGPLGRYLIVMDALDGSAPIAGLDLGSLATKVPAILRHLPDRLAFIASALHRLDPRPLALQLAELGGTMPTTVAEFVGELGSSAEALGRHDLGRVAKALIDTQPAPTTLVISHGDLHPLNLIVAVDDLYLIDWAVALVAPPGFTVGFTHLVLSSPPVVLPRPLGAMTRWAGRHLADRFLSTYRRLTDGTAGAVDDENLDWHRKVHALRILVEAASWDAHGEWPDVDHPWTLLGPAARRLLGISQASEGTCRPNSARTTSPPAT